MSEVLLTMDTSTPAGSVAVTCGEKVFGEILLNVPNTHSDRLLKIMGQLLADTGLSIEDVDGFGIILGPGSFTGLRVGIATVKGLALATKKPVIGVSSLRMLAMQAPFARHPVCALLDARKKEVYAGMFDWEHGLPMPLGAEVVIAPETLLSRMEGEVLFLGDGAVAYRTLIVRRLGSRAHFLPWPLHPPRASCAAALIRADFMEGRVSFPAVLVPHYIRPSEAEVAWAVREGQEA
jgi:tRNA threonylcarbamoyladenosine biosynthesis protein TsaB